MEALLERSREFLSAPAAAPTARERRRRRVKVVVVVALACLVVKTGSGYAAQTQTLGLGLSPTKLKRDKRKPATITISATTLNETAPNKIPSPTVYASFNFDDDFVFNGRIARQTVCRREWLDSLSTELAVARCPNSVLGTGAAVARFPWPVDPAHPDGYEELATELTAFKGPAEAGTGRPQLVILARVESAAYGGALLGTIRPSRSGKDFGYRLDISVPTFLDGLAALTDFKIRIGGRNGRGYVTARCADRNRKLNMNGRITYLDGSSLGASAKSSCVPV
jgi:hypothetical protein